MEKMNEVKQALKYLELDAKEHSDNFSANMIVSTKTMLAITEAFRALEHSLKDANVCVEAAKQEIADLEQRAETAEAEAEPNPMGAHAWEKHARRATAERDALQAKLAELEKDEPVGYLLVDNETGSVHYSVSSADVPGLYLAGPVYARPAPAINLAELVPDEAPNPPANISMAAVEIAQYLENIGFNRCRAAVLRKIEGTK